MTNKHGEKFKEKKERKKEDLRENSQTQGVAKWVLD